MTAEEKLKEIHPGFTREDFGLHGNGEPVYWEKEDVLEAMKQYASSKWISVNERLPESPTRYVIAFIENGPGIINTSKTITTKNDLWQFVTYWQPVPPPPNQ